jgi:hypothetical protein
MARTLRMPSEAELPPGTIRDFVELLFYFYKTAHRPTLREISSLIEKSGLPGTASTETIRRMLRGKTVPSHWETVEAVLVVLSDLGGRTPDVSLTWENERRTRRQHLQHVWDRALDNPDLYYQLAVDDRPGVDPWAADGPGGYSEELPF